MFTYRRPRSTPRVTLFPPPTSTTPSTHQQHNANSYVAAGDLNGDGDIDLASASFSDGAFYWHENTDGAGTYAPGGTEVDSMDSAQSVVMADIDQDGDLDLVVSRFFFSFLLSVAASLRCCVFVLPSLPAMFTTTSKPCDALLPPSPIPAPASCFT